MLGRLLRTSSFTELVPFMSGTGCAAEEMVQNEPFYMTDDLKTLLFGSRDKSLFEHVGSERLHHGFRLIIAQELGHMTSRNNHQVVLDHISGNFTTTNHIPLNELKDYIFGSPIRTNDHAASSDKVKVVKGAGIVLFTRIFHTRKSSTLRIAISCCVSDDLLPILTECWIYISSYLDYCEGLLTKWLLKNDTQILLKDWKTRNFTEVATVLQSFQRRIIPLLSGYSDTPRLFLYPLESPEYIQTWAKYVTSWIELKDGTRLKFLPVLLAKFRYDFGPLLQHSANSRVVILTGNMNVSNMLIFILTAFLRPRYNGKLHKSSTSTSTSNHSESLRKLKERSALDFPFDIKTSNSLTETNKGWEIPRTKRNPTFSTTSVSSDETGVQNFIQPSSLKSGASSVHYLSSSLNSAYGSYGSWFKKVGHSPSAKSNDSSQEGSVSLHRNNSSTSLHQQALLSNANNSQRITPQPSPSITEYDEYPWLCASPVTRDSPRIEKRSTPVPFNVERKSQNGIYDIDMKRIVNRMIDDDSLSDAFSNLVIASPDFNLSHAFEKHGDVVEVATSLPENATTETELLPRYTSYLPHFNQWFQLQACQISPDSETKIINSMKRDLSYGNTDSTSTLVISLRSREIKQITIVKDSNDRFVQRTKKIFQSGKIGPVSKTMLSNIESMDLLLKQLIDNHDNEKLPSLFSQIVM